MKVLFIFKYFNELNDVWVLDLLEYFDFAPEDLDLGDFGLADGFDGVPLFRLSVHALSHHAVVAVSQLVGVDVVLGSDVGESVGDHDGGPRAVVPREAGHAPGRGPEGVSRVVHFQLFLVLLSVNVRLAYGNILVCTVRSACSAVFFA